MMHVTQHAPVTWRSRTLEALAAELDLSGRAQWLYRQLTAGPDVLARLRAVSRAVLSRFHKGRAATQVPSAFERVTEEIVALDLAGEPKHALYLPAVALRHLADDLGARAAITEQQVLEAIQIAERVESAERSAETAMLTRADRAICETSLAEIEERTLVSIAADQRKAAAIAQLRRQLRQSRRPLRVVRGEVAS